MDHLKSTEEDDEVSYPLDGVATDEDVEDEEHAYDEEDEDDDDEEDDDEEADVEEDTEEADVEDEDEEADAEEDTEEADVEEEGDMTSSIQGSADNEALSIASFEAFLAKLPTGATTPTSDITPLILKMIKQRGYTVVSCDAPDVILATHDQSGHVLATFRPKAPKVGIQQARSINKQAHQFNARDLIVVSSKGVTSVAKRLMQSLFRSCTFFETSELSCNFPGHRLVQHHSLLQNPTRFLKQHHLTKAQLPVLSRNDPISKYHGFVAGNIVRIRRAWGDGIEPHDYFRVVQ